MNKLLMAAILATGAMCTQAQAKLQVFACEPEWGAMLQELAGDKIDVDVATTALQDVHQIEAKPSLIAKIRRAAREESCRSSRSDTPNPMPIGSGPSA